MTEKLRFDALKDRDITQIPYLSEMGLFALLRSLSNIYRPEQKIGDESKLRTQHFRFGQSAHLAFQAKQVNSIQQLPQYIKVDIKGFGMFGPNGPLPLHISEYTYEKKLHQKEHSFNDFVDIFHHRLIALFYKSWRAAQDIVSLDDGDQWQFSRFVSSVAGLAECQRLKPSIPLYQQLYLSSYRLNQNLPLGNLKQILRHDLKLPLDIHANIGQWIDARTFCTQLSAHKHDRLGDGLLIGERIFDVTQKFRIIIGPISPYYYQKFLAKQSLAKKLIALVEQYARYQYQWDVEIIIDYTKIIPKSLGQGMWLGINTWLAQPQQNPSVLIQY